MECFICGAKEEDGAKMHQVISDTEIVTVCEDCLRQTSLPRIKTTSGEEEQDALKHRQDNWRDRVKKQINEQSSKGQSFKIASSTGVSLRDVVERKMNPSLLSKLKPKTDLIKNFNWEVLRVRRQLKLTQMKLGTAVGESELTIRMLERGVVPDEYHPLIEKLEKSLKINLFTEEYRKLHEPLPELTVGDVKDAQDSEEGKEPYWRRIMNKIFSKKDKEDAEDTKLETSVEVIEDNSTLDLTNAEEIGAKTEILEDSSKKESPLKKDLSPEEINALIFGSKKK